MMETLPYGQACLNNSTAEPLEGDVWGIHMPRKFTLEVLIAHYSKHISFSE